MNCSGCGATMQVVGNHNHFHCTHCGGFHFPEETSEGVVSLGDQSTRSCPVCKMLMEKAMIEGEEIRYCQHCRGFLTLNDAFSRIVSKRRALHRPNEQVIDPFDAAELTRELRCPGCHDPMEAHPYFGGGNAVVDTCERCHLIWLDAGELSVIERYNPHETNLEPVATISDDTLPQDVLHG
jgi:Zn-finger nucleic acid-binding protein